MALAADLLLEPGATVGATARAVGYGSPFTFSTAFKRTYGQSPRAYRDARRARGVTDPVVTGTVARG
jgi:AraC-like DNA-binding protein